MQDKSRMSTDPSENVELAINAIDVNSVYKKADGKEADSISPPFVVAKRTPEDSKTKESTDYNLSSINTRDSALPTDFIAPSSKGKNKIEFNLPGGSINSTFLAKKAPIDALRSTSFAEKRDVSINFVDIPFECISYGGCHR